MSLQNIKVSLAEMHPVVINASKRYAELLEKARIRKASDEEKTESRDLYKALRSVKPIYRALRKLESVYALKPGADKVKRVNDFYEKLYKKVYSESFKLHFGKGIEISDLKIPSPESIYKTGAGKNYSISEMGKVQREEVKRKHEENVAAYLKVQKFLIKLFDHVPDEEINEFLNAMDKAGHLSVAVKYSDIKKKLEDRANKDSKPRRKM